MSDLILMPGHFYRSFKHEVWCCFKVSLKPEHAAAHCVRTSDGRVEYFYRDGRYDGLGKREHRLVEQVYPYRGITSAATVDEHGLRAVYEKTKPGQCIHCGERLLAPGLTDQGMECPARSDDTLKMPHEGTPA